MKILVLGGSGLVGSRFLELCKDDFEILAPASSQLNIINIDNLNSYIKQHSFEVVLNLIGFTNVDLAEEQKDNFNGDAYKINALAVHNLAKICADLGKHLFHISTDYVFDGLKNSPYLEEDLTNPVNWYGRTKLIGEEGILSSKALYAIVRIEMPYSAAYNKKSDFARFFYNKLKEGAQINALTDQNVTPIFVDDCIKALTILIKNKFKGIIHVASSDSITPFEFAKKLANKIGMGEDLINPVKFEEFNAGRIATRPKNSWVSVKKFESIFGKGILKSNEEGLSEFLKQIDN